METTEVNPEALVLELMYGRWRTQTMAAGLALGVFDALGAEPKPAAEVASGLGLDPALAYRLLRALAALGLLSEPAGQAFAVTAAGAYLQKDHPQSLRDIILLREGTEHTAVWKHLPAIVREGVQNGFVREYGRPAFEHAAYEPGYGQAFDAGMSSYSRLQTAWVLAALRDYDFSAIQTVCDIGGGQGHLLSHLLQAHPHLTGMVLERAGLPAEKQRLWAERLKVGDRFRFMAGDMFAEAPAADAYCMKLILHDWNDAECVQILKNAHRAAPAGGRIFIVEHVISDQAAVDYAALFDMHMMVWGTGRERAVEEYASLLAQAGWSYVTTWFPANGVVGVVEGRKNG